MLRVFQKRLLAPRPLHTRSVVRNEHASRVLRNLGSSPGASVRPGNRFAAKFENPNRNHEKTSAKKSPAHRTNHKQRANRFNLDTCTPKCKEALISVLEKVRRINPKFKVRFIDEKTGKPIARSLFDIVNETDFEKQGIQLINDEAVPLVKRVKVQEMLKKHSDELAKQIESSLLQQGSSTAMRAAKARERADKKKNAAKIVALSWNISLGDLRLQKKAEILKRIHRAERFSIYITGYKSNYQKAKSNVEDLLHNEEETGTNLDELLEQVEDVDNFELRRRQLTLEALREILEETETKYEVHGNMEGTLTINCTPKPKADPDVAEMSTKELKKQKQTEKQRQREQQKKTQKLEEDDLDALYAFKIVD